ncbi:hypothetical protein [Sphingomonas sp. 2378]
MLVDATFASEARLSSPTIYVAASLPIVTPSARDYRTVRFADG